MMHEATPSRQALHSVTSAAYFDVQGVRRWIADENGTLVVAGRASAWVTRDNDVDDHVLAPGERLSIRRGDTLTVEPMVSGQAVWLDWQAERVAPSALLSSLAGSVARLAASLARSAEAFARRAQGEVALGR